MPGDVGLGDPFRVTCESVEAVHVVHGNRIMVGCDNNFPNTGRNPGLADDNEFILVDVPRLRGHGHGHDDRCSGATPGNDEAAGQMNLTCGSGWWPGAGSNRRPTDFQSVARTN